jgi:hypothetical protein
MNLRLVLLEMLPKEGQNQDNLQTIQWFILVKKK